MPYPSSQVLTWASNEADYQEEKVTLKIIVHQLVWLFTKLYLNEDLLA